MSVSKKRLFVMSISICLVLALLLPGCTSGAPAHAMVVQLSMSDSPVLGKPVQVTNTFALQKWSKWDAENTRARIELPEGFELVEGKLEWNGDVLRGKTYEITATIRAIKTGDWKIRGGAFYSPSKGDHRGGTDNLYISVYEDHATVSDDMPARPEGPLFTPPAGWKRPPPSEPVPPSTFIPRSGIEGFEDPLTVTGRLACKISVDEVPPPDSIRDDVVCPMVWGGVWVYDTSDNLLGKTITGTGTAAGEFTIVVENPGPELGLYVVAMPRSTIGEVFNIVSGDYYYRLPQTWFPSQGMGTLNITPEEPFEMPDNPNDRGAWRIYETIANDVYDRGAYYFLKYGDSGPQWDVMPVVTVFYPSPAGTRYVPVLKQIHIEEEDDTRALDTVQHEYGHRVMEEIYGIDFPWYISFYHDMRLASSDIEGWCEGWADFFPLIAQNEYVFEWGNGVQQDLEVPTWGTPEWDNGPQVEGRVAGSLWDICDSVDDGCDMYDGEFSDIWSIFSTQTDDTFLEFWQSWLDGGKGQDALETLLQNTILTFPAGFTMFSFPLELDPPGWGWLLDDPNWIDEAWGYDTQNELPWYQIIISESPGPYIGAGYFIKHSEMTAIDFTGDPVPEEVFTIHLYPGWNVIGTPFQFTVAWGNAQVSYDGQTVNIAQAHENQWVLQYLYWAYQLEEGYITDNIDTGRLIPWLGYWLHSDVECDLLVPPPGSGGRYRSSTAAGLDWYIDLEVDANLPEGHVADIQNYAGVAGDTSVERDRYDAPEPPAAPGTRIRAWFEAPGGFFDGKLCRDIRPEAGRITYGFKVKASFDADNGVTVTWDSSQVPANYTQVLLEDTGAEGGSVFIDMRSQSEYTYNSESQEERFFNIIVESLPTVKATLQGGIRPYPDGFQVPLTLRLYDDELTLDINNIMTAEWLYEYSTENGDIEIIDIDQQAKTITFAVYWDCDDDIYNVTLWDTHVAPWDHTLINLMNDVDLFALETLDMGMLQEGNPNADVQINGADFSLLLNDYLQTPSGPKWNDGRCDFDHTFQVTSVDYSLMSLNYNHYSPIEVGGEKAGGEQKTFSKVDLSIKAGDAAKSFSEGKTFFTTIKINAGTQKVDAVDAFLTFDPAYLEVMGVIPGKALGVTMVKDFDNAKGTITLSLGKDMESDSASGTFTLGTIEFKPKKKSKATSIAFKTSYPRKTDVAYHGESLLGITTDLQVRVKKGGSGI